MHSRKKVHLALPSHHALSATLEDALRNISADQKFTHLELTNDVNLADAVVTDSSTLQSELRELLPRSARFLQLVDCGAGLPDILDENLVIANASTILSPQVAEWAITQWDELAGVPDNTDKQTPKVAGIVGLGSLGLSICERLHRLNATIWINDIRTPRQQSFQPFGARRSSLDMLLSLSDVVFVAVHHGPTSDPLLSKRELRLLSEGATVVNLSTSAVVDIDAIANLNMSAGRDIIYRELAQDFADTPVATQTSDVARFVLDNLGVWVAGGEPRSMVESVSFPAAGDPAFWSSRMMPRQTPA